MAFRHRRNVYAARLMDLRNRSIALRERSCMQFARGRKVSVYDSIIIIIIMARMAVGWLPHRGELSTKCEEFLAGRSQFDSDHGIPFHAAHERSFRVRCRHRSTADNR